MEGCAPLVTDRVEIVADLKIARGLDYYTGTVFETRLDGLRRASARSAPAAATTRSPPTGVRRTPASASRSGSAGSSCRCWARASSRPTARCRARCWSPWSTRSSRTASDALAEQLRGNGVACEVAPAAQKFGKQIRYAERRGIPYVLFPGADERARRDQGHPQRRADRGRPDHLDAAGRGPPAARPTQRTGATVIRTHDAGSLRPSHVDTEVTLAGWVARRRDHGGVAFIDLREASGVVQVVIRDEAVAHNLRSEYCLKVTGTVSLRPEGNQNPNLPTGEIEVIATDVEVLSPCGRAAVPDRRPRRGRRGGAAQAPLPRPAPQRPQRGPAAAQQGQQGGPRRARPRTTSSRSRRRP